MRHLSHASLELILYIQNVTLKAAWEMYKVYCEDARVPYPFSQRTFKEELKNYFREFTETFNDGAGSRNVYSGFRSDIFEKKVKEVRRP